MSFSLSDHVLNEVERVSADGRDCSKDEGGRGGLDPVDVPVDAALYQVLHCRFEAHLQEWRARLLHTLPVKCSVVAVERNEVSYQREMALVNCDTIDIEHRIDLL